MSLSPGLINKLEIKYEPSSVVDMRHKDLDITFRTDPKGDPILLFIGRRDQLGRVKGQRYVRTLKFGPDGNKIKDHWELKGKAS